MFLLKTILHPIAGICFFAACTQPVSKQQAGVALQKDTLSPAPRLKRLTPKIYPL